MWEGDDDDDFLYGPNVPHTFEEQFEALLFLLCLVGIIIGLYWGICWVTGLQCSW